MKSKAHNLVFAATASAGGRCIVWTSLTLAVFSLGLAGCGSLIPPATPDPTRYYVLTGPATESTATTPGGRLRIGLRPIELPSYLRNTKSIVVRRGVNELVYHDFSRWAEPLDVGVSRVLKEQLAASDATKGVFTPPFPADVTRDGDLVVRIVQCEGCETADGKTVARFSATYSWVAGDGSGQIVVRKNFNAPDAAWDGKNFSELAQLLSEATAALSRDIAANLPK